MSVKHDILRAIVQLGGTAPDAAALVTLLGPNASHGAHGITHVIWRLQKQGFVTFATHKTSKRRQYPVNIKITAEGRAYLDGQQ